MTAITEELIRCKTWITSALEYSGGTHTYKDVVDGVLTGRYQLWPGERGCCVTEIVRYPQRKVLHIFLAGGELQEILSMELAVSEFGKMHGCDRMTLAGRPGWKKALPEWRQDFIVMGRDL